MSAKKDIQKKLDPLTRAILTRERRVKKLEEQIRSIREYAENDIAVVRRRMSREQILLDALKRGQLQP